MSSTNPLTSPSPPVPSGASPAPSGSPSPAGTTPAARALVGVAVRCPSCAKALPRDASRCPDCGVQLAARLRCIHCHATVDVLPSDDARFVCSLCGGVRIPLDDAAISASKEETEHLQEAAVAHAAKVVWSTIAAVVSGFGLLSAFVLSLVASVADPGIGPVLAGALAVAATLAFAGFAWQKARSYRARFAAQLDDAWIAAALDFGRAHGGQLDAARLSKATHLDSSQAEQLLARMSARKLLASSNTPEGALRYTLLDGRGGQQP